jgi:hypothetical protein
MKRLQFAILVSLAASSAAYAETELSPIGPNVVGLAHGQDYIPRPMKPAAAQRIRSPNECAPDTAQPLWGAGAILLGYNCYHSENGN